MSRRCSPGPGAKAAKCYRTISWLERCPTVRQPLQHNSAPLKHLLCTHRCHEACTNVLLSCLSLHCHAPHRIAKDSVKYFMPYIDHHTRRLPAAAC